MAWTISKLVTNSARHRDLADRETDGAVHWNSLCPKLRRAFQSEGAQTFSDSVGFDHVCKGSNKNPVSILPELPRRSIVSSRYSRAGGELIAPELMNHVAIPLRWKDFLYHVGSSFNVNSILQAGVIVGGKDTKQGRQTLFFTPLAPFGMPQKKNSKISQDVVSWINLGKVTKEKVAILADKVSRHYLSRFSAQTALKRWYAFQGDKILCPRIPTPRPAPKTV